MKFRKSIRLKEYDYSQVGAYFITLCTSNYNSLFGEIISSTVKLNPIGEMVQNAWITVEKHHENIYLDEFVVMPNHFHGIIVIEKRTTLTISEIIRKYKSYTTVQYIKMNCTTDKKGLLWQRNYYEHIIRNEKALQNIREYIYHNPLRSGRPPRLQDL